MTEAEEMFREKVADTLAAMSNEELAAVEFDAREFYPAPTGLSDEGLTIVYELVTAEINTRKEV